MSKYIPIKIFSATVSSIVVPIAYTILGNLKLPKFKVLFFESIIWPDDMEAFSLDYVVVNIYSSLSTMLIYGLISPPLAAVILFEIFSKCQLWRLLIGRVCLFHLIPRSTSQEGSSHVEACTDTQEEHKATDRRDSVKLKLILEPACENLLEKLVACLWPVVLLSCLYQSIYFYDVALDTNEYTYMDVLYIPCVYILSISSFLLICRFYERFTSSSFCLNGIRKWILFRHNSGVNPAVELPILKIRLNEIQDELIISPSANSNEQSKELAVENPIRANIVS